MDKRKKHFVKLRAEEIRRKPPTKTQKRNQMCTYLKNIANYKHSQLKNKSFREIQILFNNTMKWVDSFVPMDSEVIEGSKSQAERSDAITIESLATKYPIVDWKTHILAEDKMYYQIIRADGSAKFYKIFSVMLDDFDSQDVLDLYRLKLIMSVKWLMSFSDLPSHSTRSEEMFEYILLMKIKLLIKKLEDSEEVTTAGYISTADEV
ncbi:hypothetical protein Tco_1069435 [Tanacetum coccineum]|uniref:Uncharacterized protein n=1 Tax=Tanacetum coccineum TaxID=301880 RepID=A0ABQ5HII2_9ASTR